MSEPALTSSRGLKMQIDLIARRAVICDADDYDHITATAITARRSYWRGYINGLALGLVFCAVFAALLTLA